VVIRSGESRRAARGAAVFVVVLAITMLTAVGLFAAHSATLVDQAAGYVRMARQTQYVAEYGALAGAAELGSGSAEPYYREMLTGQAQCRALPGTDLVGAPCYKIFYSQLDDRTRRLSNEPLIEDQSGTKAGFVGYTADGVTDGVIGDFVIELTDPGPTGAPIAGTDVGGTGLAFRYVKVTATTTAQMRPPGTTCTNEIATLTGQQALRTHFVIGPIPQ
jgi:hypothetical protein